MRGTPPYVVAIDEGTTGTSAVVFDARGRRVARTYEEIPQFFPRPAWVEHDAEAIWRATVRVLRGALRKARVPARRVAALGITNQRETVVAWDGRTGRPLHRALVWQDRRTADLCGALRARGDEGWVRSRTGLLFDPYFSGTKIRWLIENDAKVRRARRQGRLRFGTIDSWLLHRLTGGRVHATDVSNASRTLLMNLRTTRYDGELLRLFGARESELPEILDSAGPFGESDPRLLGRAIPITGIAGDQQAALFGQACFARGDTKNTYGTGCFALTNVGPRAPRPPRGILGTAAWRLKGRTTYALEGSVFVGGAVVQWLRDGLRILSTSAESEPTARSVPDDGGVVLVPAFTGLGAPHWDPYARGAIFGITRGTDRGHLARAALQSIALQSGEVIRLLGRAAGKRLRSLRVDGGATTNPLLMQYQADLLDVPVEAARYAETTAQGAAFMAGVGAGIWPGTSAVARLWAAGRRYRPRSTSTWRKAQWARWREAVRRTRGWALAVR